MPALQLHWALVLLTISAYLTVSIALTFFNKLLFTTWDFHFPISTTAFTSTISSIVFNCFRAPCCPSSAWTPAHLSTTQYFTRVVPIGILYMLEVVCSNKSLQYLPVVMYTVVKCASPAVAYVVSVAFRLESFRFTSLATVIMVCVGLYLVVSRETTSYDPIGIVLVVFALVAGNVVSAMSQILLRNDSDCAISHPVTALALITPVMTLTCIPVAVWLEGQDLLTFFHTHDVSSELKEVVLSSGMVLVFQAVCYFMLKILSVTSICMLAAVKELIIVFIACVGMREPLTAVQFGGVAVCLAGVIMYQLDRQRNESSLAKTDVSEHKLATYLGTEVLHSTLGSFLRALFLTHSSITDAI